MRAERIGRRVDGVPLGDAAQVDLDPRAIELERAGDSIEAQLLRTDAADDARMRRWSCILLSAALGAAARRPCPLQHHRQL